MATPTPTPPRKGEGNKGGCCPTRRVITNETWYKVQVPAGLWTDLSARERDIVRLVLAGHPTAGIAKRLGIAPGTVKNHRRRIYDKLDITSERE